jgi:hypothetical protein
VVGLAQPGQDVAQRGLSTAARPGQREALTGADRHGQVLEQPVAAEGLGDVLRRHQWRAGVRARQGSRASLRPRPAAGPVPRFGGEQAPGVGVVGCGEHRRRLPSFDQARVLHDQDVAAQGPGEVEVVRDGQQVPVALEVPAQQRREVRAGALVEPLGRFVGDQHGGPADGGGCEGHPLGHPAGQGVRVGPPGGGDAEGAEIPCGVLPGRPPVPREHGRTLGHLMADVHGGVEREHRFLRQQRDAAPPEVPAVAAVGEVVAGAVELQAAARRQAGRQRAHHRLGEQGLARTALADQRHRAAGLEGHLGDVDQDPVAVPDLHRVQDDGHEALPVRRPSSPSTVRARTAIGASDIQGASA